MKQIKLKDFPQFISIRYPWHYALPDPDHEIPELRSREKMLEKINEFLVCKPEHFETLKIALGITVGSSERETIGKNILKRIFEGEIRQIPISVIAKKLRELTEPDVRIWQCSKLIDLLSKYCYSVEDLPDVPLRKMVVNYYIGFLSTEGILPDEKETQSLFARWL